MKPQNRHPVAPGYKQTEIRPLEGQKIIYNVISSSARGILIALFISLLPYTLRIDSIPELNIVFTATGLVIGAMYGLHYYRLKAHQAIIITENNIIVLSGYDDQHQIPKTAVKKLQLHFIGHRKPIFIQTDDGSSVLLSGDWSLSKARKILNLLEKSCDLPTSEVRNEASVGSPIFKKIMLVIFVFVVTPMILMLLYGQMMQLFSI